MQHLTGYFAVNYKECLMTRIQKMSLDYHFKVEQEAGSSAHGFFGFNGLDSWLWDWCWFIRKKWDFFLIIPIVWGWKGISVSFHCEGTAGVWRISALNEAGGWEDRTTVEDMDLAIRACLKGWRFVYVGDVKVTIVGVFRSSVVAIGCDPHLLSWVLLFSYNLLFEDYLVQIYDLGLWWFCLFYQWHCVHVSGPWKKWNSQGIMFASKYSPRFPQQWDQIKSGEILKVNSQGFLFHVGQEWIAEYVKVLPRSAASVDLRRGASIQEAGSGNTEGQGG